ncbi:GNAT family N-acetyltransferase [Aeromicrobium sp. IC_218]|uniref:GNAT family N-acetyltransferase n=1 Tax=Aeromicrobium sp. IC_218 TaxID=2545468 RepID=UPI00103D8F30|nr:GNAT family N-acetyltransferase [Aeromicrobium sp. IC_218]TCI97818.1 GNAT family N-acetyltransferase [Aeromicrobium sp. IC_218]
MTEQLPWPLCVPVLTDGEVTLRAHTPDDVDDLHAMSTDPETQRWTSVPADQPREGSADFALRQIPAWWADGSSAGFAIEAPDDDGRPRFAGNVDLRGGPVASIGYALAPWARGRGVMRRAVDLAVQWGFAERGVEAVHWSAHVGNEASLRVAHACGFELVGTSPASLHERGRVLDAWTAVIRFGDAPVPRTRWAEPIVLEGERVRLRPLREGDLLRVVQACTDPLTRQWVDGLPDPYTLANAADFLAESVWHAATGEKATWAIADAADDELAGLVSVMGLRGLDPTSGEIGYWAHPEGRGRGLLTEAVALAVRHALDPDGLDRRRLTLHAAAGNGPSNAIAVRNGFERVGTERAAERLGDGTYDDLHAYDLLRA